MSEQSPPSSPSPEVVSMEGSTIQLTTAPGPQMSLELDGSNSPPPTLPSPPSPEPEAVTRPATPPPLATPGPPPPAPSPKRKPSADRLLQELQTVKGELEAARDDALAQASKMKTELAERRNTQRLGALRDMGAKDVLSDAQLLQLAPAVDVKSPEGRARVDEWKAANPQLFNPVEGSIMNDPAKFLAGVKSTPFGTFGPHTAQAMIDHVFAGDKK